MKKKKFEMENGMQPIPMSSEEKAERKRLKREMKEKKREERRLLRNQNKITGADTGNKNKCRGSSLSVCLYFLYYDLLNMIDIIQLFLIFFFCFHYQLSSLCYIL